MYAARRKESQARIQNHKGSPLDSFTRSFSHESTARVNNESQVQNTKIISYTTHPKRSTKENFHSLATIHSCPIGDTIITKYQIPRTKSGNAISNRKRPGSSWSKQQPLPRIQSRVLERSNSQTRAHIMCPTEPCGHIRQGPKWGCLNIRLAERFRAVGQRARTVFCLGGAVEDPVMAGFARWSWFLRESF